MSKATACGGRAPCEHVLDRAGAPKLLRWQRCCRLAAHGWPQRIAAAN
jgi:hypothetical protein